MSPAPLYPLRFKPIFKPAIWGGRRLAEIFPDAPAEGPIGEAWLLSDHGDDVSVIADGPLAGTTLRELMRDRREELLGPSLAHYDTFPLLLKIIDARENLSVQVHPDDALAQSLAGVPRGKTEAWYVLHAEPGSRIYAGLKPGVDQSRLEQAIANGTVVDCLHSFEPTVGDCVYLPAGTVHALGGGITIFEVQQTSDTTYRLFDWNRVDAKTGRPRELHIEQAVECIDFARGPVDVAYTEFPNTGVRVPGMVNSPYFFLMPPAEFREGAIVPPPHLVGMAEFGIVVTLGGAATLRTAGGSTELRAFDVAIIPPTAVVPPGAFVAVKPRGAFRFLQIWPNRSKPRVCL